MSTSSVTEYPAVLPLPAMTDMCKYKLSDNTERQNNDKNKTKSKCKCKSKKETIYFCSRAKQTEGEANQDGILAEAGRLLHRSSER
jgi:hypothetical protein